MNHLVREVGRSAASNAAKISWFARFHYASLWTYLAFCGFFLSGIETPLNQNWLLMRWELNWVAPPLALVVFGSAWRHRVYLRRALEKSKGLRSVAITSFFFYFVVLVLGIGVVKAVNASGGPATPIYLHGPVISKYLSHGRHTTTEVTIEDLALHHRFSFEVSSSEYNAITIGQEFGKSMYLGRLGVFYRWKF